MVDDRDFRQMLRGAAVRVTRPRPAVLETAQVHRRADTAPLIRTARRHVPGVSHQAVYDPLPALTTAALVCQILPPGSAARYVARPALRPARHHRTTTVSRSTGPRWSNRGAAPNA